jgi:hypothetical protein
MKCYVKSGYLIEKTFATIWREFLASRELYQPELQNKGGYSTPRTDVPPEQMPKQYRGLQREPLVGWIEKLRNSGVVEPTDEELEASLFLEELNRTGKANWHIVFGREDAREVVRRIKPPVEREMIWARMVDFDRSPPPEGTVLLGYEPNEFYPPICCSAVAQGMFFTFTEPEPDDPERVRFKTYHEKLNRWGLFDTPADAEEYLKVYRSLLAPGLQQYVYYTTEVRGVNAATL